MRLQVLHSSWTRISMEWTSADKQESVSCVGYSKGLQVVQVLQRPNGSITLHLCAKVRSGRALLHYRIQWFSIKTSRGFTSEYEMYFNPCVASLGYIPRRLCNGSNPHTFLHPLAPYSGWRKGTRYTVKLGGILKICGNWYYLYVGGSFSVGKMFLETDWFFFI